MYLLGALLKVIQKAYEISAPFKARQFNFWLDLMDEVIPEN